jgi:hypothetical protein
MGDLSQFEQLYLTEVDRKSIFIFLIGSNLANPCFASPWCNIGNAHQVVPVM